MTRDPDALLCERCGYELTGLPRAASCPECGRAVADSHPEHRIGSPWQQRPGLRSWLGTVALPALQPLAMWDRIRVGGPDGGAREYGFALITLAAAAMPVVALMAADATPHYGNRLTFGLAMWVLFFALLLGAFHVETFGIRFFGRTHRWRITGDVAYAACAHATPGWLVGGLLFVGADLLVRAFTIGHLNPATLAPAALAGLLCFETLVYIGMRRMKFANRLEASPDRT